MSRKPGVVILLILMLSNILAACGDSTATPATNPSTTPATTAPSSTTPAATGNLATAATTATLSATSATTTSSSAATVANTTSAPTAGTVANLADDQNLRVLVNSNKYCASCLSPNLSAFFGLGELLWTPLLTHDANYKITNDGLAPAPDVSSDGLTYTFHLRKDAKYSDGSPITANDVAFELRYNIMTGHPKIKGKKLLGINAINFYAGVVGAKAVFDGNVPPDEFDAAPVEGVKALDDYTLEIKLVAADPGFIYSLLINPPTAVKPADIQRGKGKNYTDDQYWPTEKGVAFSGSMQLQSYTPNQGLVMVPNPHYFGKAPKLQKITLTLVKDTATAITAFQNKEADWLDIALGAADVQNVSANPELKRALVKGDTYDVNQLFVTPYAPLDDVHVRRAIYQAIDKKALTNVLGGGSADQTFYTPLVSHVANPNACPGVVDTLKPLAFDPVAAKAELAQSKYGADVVNMQINIGLIGQPTDTDKLEAQFLQQALKTNLGLTNVQIHQEPISDISKPPYQPHIWPNIQGNFTPDLYGFINNMAALIPTEPYTASGPSSILGVPYAPDVTDLMKQAKSAPTLDQRCAVLSKVLQAWTDQQVSMDLFTDANYVLVAPWVKNLHQAGGIGGTEYMYLNPGIEDTYIEKH
jgi:ABC-type transport system substrate-binding protein